MNDAPEQPQTPTEPPKSWFELVLDQCESLLTHASHLRWKDGYRFRNAISDIKDRDVPSMLRILQAHQDVPQDKRKNVLTRLRQLDVDGDAKKLRDEIAALYA